MPYLSNNYQIYNTIIGQTPLVYDLPLPREVSGVVDANGNATEQNQYGSITYQFCFSAPGFVPVCQNFLIQPGNLNRLPVAMLQSQ